MATNRRPRVFIDVEIAGQPLGRIIFQLYSDLVPKTAEKALCTGELGLSTISGQALYYKNAIFHRVIPEFMIQGGDITKHNGSGGESIYATAASTTFADEPEGLAIPLSTPGLLVMANRGPHTNSSQFFITLAPCEHLNGKHVVFGKVVRGFDEVVKKIEAVKTAQNDKPIEKVVIAACGELEFRGAPPGQLAAAAVVPAAATKRGRSRSKSTASDSDSEDEEARKERKRRRKEEKKEAKRKRKEERGKHRASEEAVAPADPIAMETEEEYDLRLEREEKERLEAARKATEARKLEEAKQGRVDERTGLMYKGRGRMKFTDPEKYRPRY
ncbi:hypothetical protein M408DRAFT_28859 [Serendipita vermifera MAFF 305830]|uniref:peptidylprolyl isomerase n=1 Tax=Serendipita vermifera MAFF 305830 TaxID=933852 RepID=A0A0C3ASH6_SERVB|nr:hypothetical protein M408DRAFT_28859 [Serendipita vermifera MAFF 305830]